jgi:hypothetical protein
MLTISRLATTNPVFEHKFSKQNLAFPIKKHFYAIAAGGKSVVHECSDS